MLQSHANDDQKLALTGIPVLAIHDQCFVSSLRSLIMLHIFSCLALQCQLALLSLRDTGVPVVLKLLKCQNYPEIVLKFEIVLNSYSFGKNVLILAFVVP